MENNASKLRRKPAKLGYSEKGRFFALRNTLNFIFLILAIAGMVTYFYFNVHVGSILLIAAVFVKLAESMMRILR